MASVIISSQTATIIEDQLINYNEDNGSYTEFGIVVDDLPRLLVRTEYLTSSAPEDLEFSSIFYDDINVFQNMDSIKEYLMDWYRSKYTDGVAILDEISDGCVCLSEFQVKPRYLKTGDTSKFMIGFKFITNVDRATINDIMILVEYMNQLKESGRIAMNAVVKRVIIGTNDYLESFPRLKQMMLQ